MINSILKVFLPAILSFLIGLVLARPLTVWMYRMRMWKGRARTDNPDTMSEAYIEIANTEAEMSTPRLGGVVVWGSVALTSFIIFLLSRIFPNEFLLEFDYLSKSQTLIPLLALLAGAGYGFFEDMVEIFHNRFKKLAHGLDRKFTIMVVVMVGLLFAWWFYDKLDYRAVTVPFIGSVEIGWWFIPYFIVVMLGTFSSRVIDGMDGLAGGVIAIVYGAFGIIGIVQGQFDIAALCFVIAGALLAFLWFNLPPAQFYMGETGMMGLVIVLPVIAFLLHRSLWILIIGFPLAATSFSSFAQMTSKKFFKRKLFRITPLHYYFQTLGWARETVVMRYWIFTAMAAGCGVLIAMIA